MDKDKQPRRFTISIGPLGLSLLAAGITAVGLAAVSLADSGNGNQGSDNGAQTFQMPGPGGGVGVATIAGPNLSEADRKKLDEFNQCMQDNGAPAPPHPGKIDPSDGPPKPPSAADREKLQKAYEACKDKLPDKLRNGPPGIGTFKCGPPPGAPPAPGDNPEQGKNQDQSSQSGTQSSGSAS